MGRVLFLMGVVVLALAACGAPPDATDAGPTPAAVYGDFIGMGGYPLVTTEPVGDIPAEARVRISHATFIDGAWVYTVVAEDEQTTADAAETQLMLAPDVTPGPTPTSG